MTYVARPTVEAGSKGAGFVREAVTYMITDDLEVKPMFAISSIALLKKTSMLGMFVHLKRLWFLSIRIRNGNSRAPSN
ncbi:hypothetical protein Pyn_35154 [Prunus yedoensis var. nudiflora]|uniref:Uncharacterized protein n=1 Tax=Prunus yedoensis var. nudiflora TaxID=2094558 RepID=A0A314YFR3_PRUYE|nr:hypothetical protein Pyn_35154 [Prunus yedoensis var. nudiflora]